MAARLPRPKIGEKWPRVRNIGAAGPEVAHVRSIRESRGVHVEYRTDNRKLPGTHVLELRAFLGNFAPPGCTDPLMEEATPPRVDEWKLIPDCDRPYRPASMVDGRLQLQLHRWRVARSAERLAGAAK